ncbi:hypothetical protein GPECTOR_46g207 [Gonium pectorale]|uniref:Sulfotransferase n=1 Tax=Gonium pectorale TaxID=33097 RepID=A0A150G8I9_GONPE|nr:hypothetical protein GPECTOR_46g207 [Gonium pectorale]|eukprot:KXZ46138.1 hypothetical protein GPECTOR_46g207 [Gonium pectorale]
MRLAYLFAADPSNCSNPGQSTSGPTALRSRVASLLDGAEPYLNGPMVHAHELSQPGVVALLQDLLLLPAPSKDTSGRRRLAGGSPEKASEPSAGRGGKPAPLPAPLSSTGSPPSLARWAAAVKVRLSSLPADFSYPVLRRMLAAVVVRAWLDGGCRGLSSEDEAAVRELFLQAELNGCTTQRFDRYFVCAVQAFGDKVRWIDGAAHKLLTGGQPTRWSLHGVKRNATAPGCEGRGQLMRQRHWSYYSNEYTLTGGGASFAGVEVCSRQFVTAILFRNPLKRLASHLRFILLHYRRFMEAQGAQGADYFKTYANASADFWQAVAPAIADNYYARTLLGEATWHERVGGLNATHADAARLVLLQYDMVVPLEADVGITSRLVAYGAGWPASYTDVHDKNITALQGYFNFDPTPFMPPSADMDRLYKRQDIDVRLYELAGTAWIMRVLIGQLDFLVYDTAASAGVLPWKGMPTDWKPSDEEADGDGNGRRVLGKGIWSGR